MTFLYNISNAFNYTDPFWGTIDYVQGLQMNGCTPEPSWWSTCGAVPILPFLIIGLFVVSFLGLKTKNSLLDSLIGSLALTTIISIFFTAIGKLNEEWWKISLLMLGVCVVLLYFKKPPPFDSRI